ncbi:replicative DNA helicase [Candidatus Saccharibacteria bacterium]|nr:replicative DNA helicase [Candidatus Saccharibacteria bacterium]
MEEKTRSDKSGRVPPQDITAEKSLLGAILLSDEYLPEVLTIINAKDFYEPKHQTIFAAMFKVYEDNKPVDLLTLTAELKSQKKLKEIGGAVYLTELSNFVPAASHAKAYAEIIERASVRRKLIHAGTEIAEKAYEDDAEVNDLIGAAEQELFEVSNKIIKSDFVAMSNLLAEALERTAELRKNKGALRGLKTGYRDLDQKTAGFQKGDLIILGARPSMGKTTFAQNFAYNVATINKAPVLFFSMEMAKSEIIDKMISAVSGVDGFKMRTGNINDDEFSRLGDALDEMDEIPIYIDDTSSMTIAEIRNKARRAHHDHGIGIIFLDYLQLITGSNRYAGNRVQELTEISRGLKSLARELNIPIVALAQLSRSVTGREDPRPVLSDIRDSGSIEQDADLVMFIHREDYYRKKDEEPDNVAELLIKKHRHGALGDINFYFDGRLSRITALDNTHE